MKITVTREDIDTGARCDGFCCPIAKAASRTIPALRGRAFVDEKTIESMYESKVYYLLPREAQAFIKAFDRGETVMPTTFELEEA